MSINSVSFLIPCYRSAATVGSVVKEIHDTMAERPSISYDVILVNDNAPDEAWGAIEALALSDKRVRGVCLARNFGQHSALMAGFHYVTGEAVICLDDDGQTPACDALRFIDELESGRDVVYARYLKKQHSGFRNFGSHVNELMARVMLGKPKELYVSSYFAARRFIVDEMVRYQNAYPYVMGLVLRTTKNISNIDVDHRAREVGRSGYTMKALLGLWFNGFTAFSINPLRLSTVLGLICAAGGFLFGLYTIIKRILVPDVPMGYSALMSVLVFIGGTILVMLGLIGEYVGRIYISLNNSPQYVVRQCTFEDKA